MHGGPCLFNLAGHLVDLSLGLYPTAHHSCMIWRATFVLFPIMFSAKAYLLQRIQLSCTILGCPTHARERPIAASAYHSR